VSALHLQAFLGKRNGIIRLHDSSRRHFASVDVPDNGAFMNVCVIGTGYVGLVAGTCFADGGNHVICVDKDASKVERLKKGEVPIYEPGLAEVIQRSVKAGRLEFTTDLDESVRKSLVVFIAVGTPQDDDGSADLSAVVAVAGAIGKAMDGYRIVVTKSTVPVGTHKKVEAAITAVTDHPVDVVSNPEFMMRNSSPSILTSVPA